MENNRKISIILLTAILVLSVFVVFVMPVAAQISGSVTTTDGDVLIKGGTNETFNFTITDARGAPYYIEYINITNQTDFTFIIGTNQSTISSDFDVDGVNLTWAITVTTFSGTTEYFAFNVTAPTLVANKTDTWTTYATYNDSQVESNTTFNVTVIENTSPTVTINLPANAWYNADFEVNATVSDAGSGVSTVQYRWENASPNGAWTDMAHQGGNYWNATFDVTSMADGNYTIRINATDNAANSNTTVNTTGYLIGIDNTAPALTVSSSEGTSTFQLSTTISGTVTETNLQSLTINGVTVAVTAGYSKVESLSLGSNTFTVVATDKAGGSTTTSITVERLGWRSPVSPTPTPEAVVTATPTATATATATPVATATPTATATPPTPGFEAVFAITGLLAAAYVVFRREE